eukprot:gene11397-biopygen22884
MVVFELRELERARIWPGQWPRETPQTTWIRDTGVAPGPSPPPPFVRAPLGREHLANTVGGHPRNEGWHSEGDPPHCICKVRPPLAPHRDARQSKLQARDAARRPHRTRACSDDVATAQAATRTGSACVAHRASASGRAQHSVRSAIDLASLCARTARASGTKSAGRPRFHPSPGTSANVCGATNPARVPPTKSLGGVREYSQCRRVELPLLHRAVSANVLSELQRLGSMLTCPETHARNSDCPLLHGAPSTEVHILDCPCSTERLPSDSDGGSGLGSSRPEQGC